MQCKDIPDKVVIELAAQWRENAQDHPGVYAALVDLYGHPKICWTKLERLADRDLITYGTSPRYAWPTEKGYALLSQK